MDTSWLRELDTPEKFRAFCDDTLAPHFLGRQVTATRDKLPGLRSQWRDLESEMLLIAQSDVTSKAEADQDLEAEKLLTRDLREALADVLLALHESHKDPITSDPDLCQNVECSRLRAQYRHLLREN